MLDRCYVRCRGAVGQIACWTAGDGDDGRYGVRGYRGDTEGLGEVRRYVHWVVGECQLLEYMIVWSNQMVVNKAIPSHSMDGMPPPLLDSPVSRLTFHSRNHFKKKKKNLLKLQFQNMPSLLGRANPNPD